MCQALGYFCTSAVYSAFRTTHVTVTKEQKTNLAKTLTEFEWIIRLKHFWNWNSTDSFHFRSGNNSALACTLVAFWLFNKAHMWFSQYLDFFAPSDSRFCISAKYCPTNHTSMESLFISFRFCGPGSHINAWPYSRSLNPTLYLNITTTITLLTTNKLGVWGKALKLIVNMCSSI